MDWLRPQKPQDYDEEKKAHRGVFDDNNDWVAEPKWDGWRINICHDVVYSSAGKELDIPWLLGRVPKGTMIDAETLGEDTDVSTDVATLIAHTPELLIVRPFDVIYHEGAFIGKFPLWQRRKDLEQMFDGGKVFNDSRFQITEQWRKDKKVLLDKMFNLGKEGIVLKNLTSQWKSGSRVGWIKVKKTYNIDVVIVDAKAPVSRWTVEPGKIGSDGKLYPEGKPSKPFLKGFTGVHYGFYDHNGQLRIVGSLGESGPPEEMEKWVGRVVEIKGYGSEPLPTGASRHPQFQRFRDDKLAEECVFAFADDN